MEKIDLEGDNMVTSSDDCTRMCVENKQCVAAEVHLIDLGGDDLWCDLYPGSYGTTPIPEGQLNITTSILQCGEYFKHELFVLKFTLCTVLFCSIVFLFWDVIVIRHSYCY